MDYVAYNESAWDKAVRDGNVWTIPVSDEAVNAARHGEYNIVLTPMKPVPHDWIGDVVGKDVLCLASGGGQQGPIFAAFGANVTVFDNSPAQLERDATVARRHGLTLRLERGDMRDLSRFPDESFDLIFHPVSNVFVDDVNVVWRECHRVLRPSGVLLSGFTNPIVYLFDFGEWDNNKKLVVAHSIPYADVRDLPEEKLRERIERGEPMEFAHTLEDQIGGQIAAGFAICGFYEDKSGGDLLDSYIDTFIATKAMKLKK